MIINKFEVVENKHRKHPQVEIKLPQRGTSYSAGYDICIPVSVEISPQSSVFVWTDIKAKVKEREFLSLHVRSSIGIKKNIMLGNITGVIDCDYYFADNGANIGLCLYNYGSETVRLEAGERVCQGIFILHDITVNDKPLSDKRIGGMGSTGN